MSRDERDLVREGYDALASRYLELRTARPSPDLLLMEDALAELPDGARVLDAGCGAGLPVARQLVERFRVTGVDISPVQIEMARENVPTAEFEVGDLSALELREGTFDGIVCLFALFHLPRDEHATALAGFCQLLRPGGVLFLSIGSSDHEGYIEEDWIGSGASLYWSHFDQETTTGLVEAAGFTIDWVRVIEEDEEFGGGTHPFVRARRL